MEIGLLLLRATVGLTLMAHGAQKLFGWFGANPAAVAHGFEALGYSPGGRHARMAGAVEVGGGLLLALGLATPVGAMLAFSVMIVAAMSAHVRNGFFLATGGFEYNLVLGVAGLTLAFTGPGAVSVDALLRWPAHGALWGLAAAVAGTIGSALQLAQRRQASEARTAAAA
jgi:putative oxidoreductase